MNKINVGMLAAALVSLSAVVPVIASTQGSGGACWGAATKDDATAGGLGTHARDVNAGGFIDSRTSAQTLGIADRPGRAGLGELQQTTGGFVGLVSFLGQTC